MIEQAGIAKSFIDLLNGLLGLGDKLSVAAKKRLSADICGALRTIYFGKGGTLGLLRQIAEGKNIDRAEFDRYLREFADGDEAVRRALIEFNEERLEGDVRLSMESAEALDYIRWGKIKVRRTILEEFGRHRRKFSEKQIASARKLVKELETLNAKIVEVEKRLNINAVDS